MTHHFGAIALTCGLILSGCAAVPQGDTRTAAMPTQTESDTVATRRGTPRQATTPHRWTCTASGAGMQGQCLHH
jgi:starvation-inducible outer membrane lipoprotein